MNTIAFFEIHTISDVKKYEFLNPNSECKNLKSLKIMKKLILLFLISIITLACERDDFNVGFVGIKKVEHEHGYGKIKLMIYMLPDTKKLFVKFNNEINSYEITSPLSDPYEIVFEDMPEGDYIFTISTVNKDGDESDEFLHFVSVYGNDYADRLITRRVISYDFINEKIIFDIAPPNHIYTVCSYIKSDGHSVTDTLKFDEIELPIENVNYVDPVVLQSFFSPSERYYELFSSSAVTKHWVENVMAIDKSGIKGVPLQHDDPGTAFGGSIANLFDGVHGDGNFYIPVLPDSPPHTITIDLGKTAKVTQVDVAPRPSLPGRLPKRYDFYGYPFDVSPEVLLAEADTEEGYPFEDAWHTEMIEKNWIYLGFAEPLPLASGWNSVEITLEPNDEVRYLRIRFDQNWDGNRYVDLSEITIYEKVYGF